MRASSVRLYHLTTRTEWEQALARGVYQTDSLTRQGFIHFSLEHQWQRTRERFYAGVADLVLLEVDPERLTAPWRLEEGEPGEDFPHLYGALNPAAVVAVRAI